MDKLFEYLENFNARPSMLHRCLKEKFASNGEYVVSWGATRVCIFKPSWDFVLKMERDNRQTDYCALEAYHYDMAKKYNVQRILLPIEKIASFENGIKVYRQTKYSTGWYDREYRDKTMSKKAFISMQDSKQFRKIMDSIHDQISYEWVARIIQLYGKKFMLSFEQWLNEYEINDLHTGNIGMLNNRPILLDYAGYRGSSYLPSQEIRSSY